MNKIKEYQMVLMNKDKLVGEAQEFLNNVVWKLSEFKVPANESSVKFLESMVNTNGFSACKIKLNFNNLCLPVVVSVEQSVSIFDTEGCE